MNGGPLQGPFLTRGEAAQRSALPPDELSRRPDLLHIGGRMLEEVYFAFQFDSRGIRRDVATVVLALRGKLDDLAIASWLTTPNTMLNGDTPLAWLTRRGGTHRVLAAAAAAPTHDDDAARPVRVMPPVAATRAPARDSTRRRGRRYGPAVRSHSAQLGHQSGTL